MYDVVIIGGGLTGLALARRLQSQGLNWALYEARGRLGGRVLTLPPPDADGARLDMGATWYWPDTEPRMAQLVAELGLGRFEQPDAGRVLSLTEPDKGPQDMQQAEGGVHAGAHRIDGGAGQVVEALAAQLPVQRVHLSRQLMVVESQPGGIDLQFIETGATPAHFERIQARKVVLAMPPRLVAQGVAFKPALSPEVLDAIQAVPTWMATQAKAACRYERPFWHDEGCSGNAFVQHGQAVLHQVWDASDAQGAALAGFVALDATQRQSFKVGLPLLVDSQLAQLFGTQAHGADVVSMDWAQEPFTCSQLDLQEPQPRWPQADPALRRSHWGGRLYFGGTETARHAAGHMEGALESASRLADALRPAAVAAAQTGMSPLQAAQPFVSWAHKQRELGLQHYRQHLTHCLSRQDAEQATQRSVLATVEQLYARSLEQLSALEPCPSFEDEAQIPQMASACLAAFAGYSKQLVEQAVQFNATSCALSNFPHEHKPSAEYLQVITADLVAAWKEFAWSVHDVLHARCAALVA